MATFWNGVGGHMTLAATNFAVIDWSLDKSSRLAEVTNSGSAGVAQYIAGVKEYSGTTNIVWDSTSHVETVALEGASVTLKLYLGSSTYYYTLTALIEKISPRVNTRQDAITVSVQWKGTSTISLTV
jgi:hypothetical protein